MEFILLRRLCVILFLLYGLCASQCLPNVCFNQIDETGSSSKDYNCIRGAPFINHYDGLGCIALNYSKEISNKTINCADVCMQYIHVRWYERDSNLYCGQSTGYYTESLYPMGCQETYSGSTFATCTENWYYTTDHDYAASVCIEHPYGYGYRDINYTEGCNWSYRDGKYIEYYNMDILFCNSSYYAPSAKPTENHSVNSTSNSITKTSNRASNHMHIVVPVIVGLVCVFSICLYYIFRKLHKTKSEENEANIYSTDPKYAIKMEEIKQLKTDSKLQSSPQNQYDEQHVVMYTDLAIGMNLKELVRIEIKKGRSMVFSRSSLRPKTVASEALCVIYALYSDQEKLQNVFEKINEYIKQKYYPQLMRISQIDVESFQGENIWGPDIHQEGIKAITNYNKNAIQQKGLLLSLTAHRTHQIIKPRITCPEMKRLNTTIPSKCCVYNAMQKEHEYNLKNLSHLNEFSHFIDEYQEKPICRDKNECKEYIRCKNGDNSINNQCHMMLFRHPPRSRCIKLAQNMHSLIVNTRKHQNHPLYQFTSQDKRTYSFNRKDGFLQALISEVIVNGYKSDLCLECHDHCNHSQNSILAVVDDKMNHIGHKQIGTPLNRGQMLALILYTGGDCNYAMCAAQRSGDYNTWKWFDFCLYRAIKCLSYRESGSFPVFTGLYNVKLDVRNLKCGYFVTYVSSSWEKNIAQSFMKGSGLIIRIDEQFKNDGHILCCDVSWISKFPDECEILFARSLEYNTSKFECKVLDDSNGKQTVALKQASDKVVNDEWGRYIRKGWSNDD